MLVLAALASACASNSPLAPADPVPLSLAAGTYQLRIFTQTSETAPGFPSYVCLSIGNGPIPVAQSIALTVNVMQESGGWRVRTESGSLVIQLTVLGDTLTGTMQGQASVEDRSVVIGESPQHLTTASVVASADPSAFKGDIQGSVLFLGPNGSQSCSSNGWSLTPH